MGPLLKDSQWVRQAFLVRKEELEKVDYQNRTFTSASLKFTDTTPGGNFAINPPPQFTRAADPKVTSQYSGSMGMGRYYSEAIDDNAQVIHMRFGVPQFNSLTTFFTGFYDTRAGQLARTGRADGLFYNLGKAAGFVVSIMSWKLLAVHALGLGWRFCMNKPSSKYYYLKPTMPLYWNAVQTIVNQIAVNRGIVPRIGSPEQGELNDKYEFDANAKERLHSLLPDIFNKDGSIDVYAMANRAQRLARKHFNRMEKKLNNATQMNLNKRMDDLSDELQSVYKEKLTDERPNFMGYLDNWLKSKASQPKETADKSGGTTEQLPTKEDPDDPEWLKFFMAEMDDGSAFASFRVNATGAVNESFSNSVQESEISSKINSMSSASRSTNFSFGNGNVFGGAFGAALGGVAGAVKDFAAGALDSLNMSGLAALGGSAFVDIPKHWQSSTASLPRASYTMHLISPYGNPISQLINIHIPLAMLLAGALPLSTGKQSYTSPFILELYDRGRCQTRLGIIDSLSITRGTGNLGFNNDGQAMSVEVTFSIIDLSSIMHMPITEGFSMTSALAAVASPVIGAAAGVGGATAAAAVVGGGVAAAGVGVAAGAAAMAAAAGVFDEDTVFSDYLAVLAGMGLADQIYQWRKFKLNLTRKLANWNSWTSASHMSSFMGDIWPARMYSAIYKGVAR